jgi:putative ABC transport system substrate-binding protein
VRSAAATIDKIWRGFKASDIPIQLPARFALVVDLKTAKAINLELPQNFLLQADKVIE